MLLTKSTLEYFSLIPFKIRAAIADKQPNVPFFYEDEPFFGAYEVLENRRARRLSQRAAAEKAGVGRERLRELEDRFQLYGTVGLLPELSHIPVAENLERLVVLIKTARPHEHASLALRLANALEIPGASLEVIRRIQRCHGYGQGLDDGDVEYFRELQHILDSVERMKQKGTNRDQGVGREHFFDFARDPMQQRVELFKEVANCQKKRQLRPLLKRFGIHPNRYYELKNRYLTYGVWGLVDRIQITKKGEKLSVELELDILEQRLMDPSLSVPKIMKKLKLKCSKSHVQKVYGRWGLSRFKQSISLRGIIGQPPP